ncbi:hypothetical protein [Yersinia phage fPS-86]|uniref:Phage capsid and scaffolding protein n=7 Tax=Helsettvirus fPS9 TaxID=2733625 RepID=A0A2C9CZK0_9CAUD|nr:head protein [Yersinia phage fPS-9]SOO46364.1 hypothetical protein [Yersinia phage fPS-52]SOO46466.1 hypothetical protein [Yersinia phage fPS-26]SOO46669.1 hypothetical protein [Yersinia phage fPS-86]SOO46868.1 hypothetical protein [Yersinia phage fPS-64]SOR54322.1 hypothetical protein [Yersinia phage fPS-10]SOR54373.1 hypothetical protein [Yersinia phage fPS16]
MRCAGFQKGLMSRNLGADSTLAPDVELTPAQKAARTRAANKARKEAELETE